LIVRATIPAYAAQVTDLSGSDRPINRMSDRSVVVDVERLVAGGVGLSRRDDGRVVLVDGGLPGERLEVSVIERRGSEHGRIIKVVTPSPGRIEPECPHVIEGCGGCDLAHLHHDAQLAAKVDIVSDALRRLGRWKEPVVRVGARLDPWGFRSTLRAAVVGGRAGLRMGSSHDVLTLSSCAVAHPLLEELLVDGDFGSATEVTLRVGTATGERIAVVTPSASGVRLPSDVLVIGVDELKSGRRAWIHEEVAGRVWRISAESFFQTRPDGAEALVNVVAQMAADILEDSTRDQPTLVDAYCGVGLFAGSLLTGREGWRAVAAERGRSSVADAKVNLADLDVRVVGTSIERFRVPSADLVIADPSRAGLGRKAVKVLAAAEADRFLLVSCDPAAAGRDVALLASEGYEPVEVVVVDMFPHTHHVEVVTRLDRVRNSRVPIVD
jgi:23S rRNA (uracil1939-C5)-methyltransferase